ncbi:hypothetical protein [Flavobacterium poyangense]|uniref:hypothetical protein n=1 Tax=Flavobacterium poyangense TaxID=2204302 RepID=UPI00141FBBE5|nr:hypothetical protein [Flavobacterium sp. JXAS1]
MRERIKNLVCTVIVLLVSGTLLKCQKDEDPVAPQKTNISLARNWFNQYQTVGNNYVFLDNLNYDWSEASLKKSGDGTETIIVPVIELKKEEREFWEQKLYIYKFATGNYKALLFEIYSNKNVKPKSQSVDGGNFTGYITVWDLKTGPVRAAKFINNKLVENGVAEFSHSKIKTDKAAPDPPCVYADFGDGGCGGLGNGDGPGIPLREVIKISKPKTKPDPSAKVIYTPRPPVTAGGTTPGGYTSPGGGNGGGGSITAPTPVKIIDELKGKAKCLNDLLTKNGNSFVQKLLANFKGTSEFDIRIVSLDKVISKESKKEINGQTLVPVGKLITIEISTDKANNNAALETVRVILHEYIHADMRRKTNTKKAKTQEVLDFKATFKNYEKEQQHSVMAILYINSMKSALKEFHKNVLPNDYKAYIDYYGEAPSDAFYEAFAWGGLQSEAVKPWNDLPEIKKAEIKALASRVTKFSKTVPCPN